MGTGKYQLQKFAERLAEIESRFAKELESVLEFFVVSRGDLPVKHLDAIGKCHSRRAKILKKAVDPMKSDSVNLWKLTNVYSASCVDQDDAMREVRAALRKHMRNEETKIQKNGRSTVVPEIKAPFASAKNFFPPPAQTNTHLPVKTPVEKHQPDSQQEPDRVEMREKDDGRRNKEKRQSMKPFTISNISKFFSDKKPDRATSNSSFDAAQSSSTYLNPTDPSLNSSTQSLRSASDSASRVKL